MVNIVNNKTKLIVNPSNIDEPMHKQNN